MERTSTWRWRTVLVAAAMVLLVGCNARSISNSGYSRPDMWGHTTASNPFYRGELTEFDVLGVDFAKPASDDEEDLIYSTLDQKPTSRLSCQILLSDELDGLKLTLAPSAAKESVSA